MNILHVYATRKRKTARPAPRPEHVAAVKGAGKRTQAALDDQRHAYEARVENVMHDAGVDRQAAIAMIVSNDPRAAAFLLAPAPAPKTTKTGEAPRTTGATAKASSTGPAATAKAPAATAKTPTATAKTPTPSTAPAGAGTTVATYSTWINGWRYRGTLPKPKAYPATRPANATAAAKTVARKETHPMFSDPIKVWNAALAVRIKGGVTQEQALRALVREQPKLHEAYLKAATAAYNERARAGSR